MEQYPSKLLEDAVNAMHSLPGVGKRTALRLVLHLLKKDPTDVEAFAYAFTNLRNNIQYCQRCHNVAQNTLCTVCADPLRDHTTVCVVENLRDVMAIENTRTYKGTYHVLGGIISPMDGVGPADLFVDSLVERAAQGNIAEVILALSATMEGDTTAFYLNKKLSPYPAVTITTIARGIAVGDDLEYADEATLGRSITNRVNYKG